QSYITRNADLVIEKSSVRVFVGFEFGENAFLGSEPERFHPRFAADKSHDPFHQFERFVGAVCNTEFEAKIGEAHDAESDRPSPFDDIVDLGKREVAGVNDVVEETRAEMSNVRHFIPIDRTVDAVSALVKLGNV